MHAKNNITSDHGYVCNIIIISSFYRVEESYDSFIEHTSATLLLKEALLVDLLA